ncbi:MAG: ammonia-forming cytochrome c nitrite reductase [Muribaculaceae bacterium]|jgi:nitrite reductase (cytochrome c-552)|nr:ammonia-forming cytochrome c nitrite reductase [Muribaculaceae bacterium]
MAKKLKAWQGWLIYGGSLVVVFVLGIIVSSLIERRSEVASIFNNRQTKMSGIVTQNEKFKVDFPNEYESWKATEDTTFKSEFNGNAQHDDLASHPAEVIFWAGYAFSRDYASPRGHYHALEDMRNTLRTGTPFTRDQNIQPGTCWTCKSPDVPRYMKEHGIANFYKAKWSDLGAEIVNPIGCSDCHDPATMNLRISRPALIEAFKRQGRDITKASQQEMRTLVCAQCHVEYYFKGDGKYLTFPWDKGLTVENIEAYYDSLNYSDFVNPISRTPILKAQHPGYETTRMGIHAQRGVSCADCHMPYKSEGGIKYSDHQIMSPLAHIDRTCQTCHRQDAEVLRQNVYDRQRKCEEIRDKLETELCKAHLEAQFAWNHGATQQEMQPVLKLIRQSQWRWDFGVASHGAAFHAPQEIMRILGNGLERALQARLAIAKIVAKHGFTGDIPLPDVSTKEKAQKYIGLDMNKLRAEKQRFINTIIPKWLQEAKAKGRLTREM